MVFSYGLSNSPIEGVSYAWVGFGKNTRPICPIGAYSWELDAPWGGYKTPWTISLSFVQFPRFWSADVAGRTVLQIFTQPACEVTSR